MPTLLLHKGFRFFFFSMEGMEPPHVHVERAEAYAKYWLIPVALARSRGFRVSELGELQRLVEEHRSCFLEQWHEHHGG